ncbi:hypothetical protein GCHA_0412 [Paraglaciecola chathamensis S18K6]|uniref:Uncharacterized protein n=2 Tax=Paraglaciecola chathamensis TaxID=368405 RepID=A0ABQ0IC70_9ALTE|nr:hypothetical protein GAGA_4032 [Paraglaciecola agarilytica NO2]GAC08376.1 hypothetical protein GCHA_0412 [Paraglaciecola chathamensis S18K6]
MILLLRIFSGVNGLRLSDLSSIAIKMRGFTRLLVLSWCIQ